MQRSPDINAAASSPKHGLTPPTPPLLSGAVVAANMGQQLKELDEMGVLHPVTVASDPSPKPLL